MTFKSFKLASIVGARPQFIKASVLSRALSRHRDAATQPKIEEILIHTGQHYDEGMSDVFFRELALPRPQHQLQVGSHSASVQTAMMMQRLAEVVSVDRPDVVVVYGDTNSTLAGALVAKQMGMKLVHIEAGLRSYNMQMPEELNRVIVDRVSDLHLCPTDYAVKNLAAEGIGKRAVLVPDVMQEALALALPIAQRESRILQQLELSEMYGVVTLHRAANTDDPERLQNIIAGLAKASRSLPLVFPVHPRTRKALQTVGIQASALSNLRLIDPVSYLDMLCLLSRARLVVTDSGGLQKEAFWLDIPCVTLRSETEWIDTLAHDMNILCPADAERIVTAVNQQCRNHKTVHIAERLAGCHAGEENLKAIIEYTEGL